MRRTEIGKNNSERRSIPYGKKNDVTYLFSDTRTSWAFSVVGCSLEELKLGSGGIFIGRISCDLSSVIPDDRVG